METTVFKVESLTCPSCANDLEKSIRRVNGVMDVKLSFTLGRLKAVYDDTAIDAAVIQKAISKAGYRATESSSMLTGSRAMEFSPAREGNAS